MSKIVVVGSCNIDITVECDRWVHPGETIFGNRLTVSPGGKGANQAVAAARLGADVMMVGCIGDDVYGQLVLKALKENNVDSTYVKGCIANKTPFEAAMADVKANFGLILPTDPDAAKAGKLLLTDYEVENLRKAYERTLEVGASSQSKMSQQDYELYGTYIPFSMAVCHTINHKSGMDHTTYAHTGASVNIYALGVGAEKFRGVFDNTEIYHKLAELTKVQ